MARPALTRMFIGVEPVCASLPVSVNSQPPQALAVGDDADLLVLGLEDRALLDVVLEIGVHLARADLLVADPADALQLVAEGLALRVLAAIGVVERVDAGEDAGGQHRRGEARALLVGPVDHDDRVARLDAEVVERADDFEPATARRARRRSGRRSAGCRDGCRHRPDRASGSVPSRRANMVPIWSSAHGHAGVLAPALEQRRALARRRRSASGGCCRRHARPDLGHLVDRSHRRSPIDAEVVGRGLAPCAAQRHPQFIVGKVNTAPDLMPSGQRAVTVFSRV